MTYKTVLVHVDDSSGASVRIRAAVALAAQEKTHLVGAAMSGVSRYFYTGTAFDDNDPNMIEYLSAYAEVLEERAREALNDFNKIASEADALSYEAVLDKDEAHTGFSLRARYSDLAVISQFNPGEQSPSITPDFPEYVVINSGRPVLIIPYGRDVSIFGKRVLVAWDGSVSATRALYNALPLLQRSEQVHLTVFNPDSSNEVHGAQPGADIALYLSRHNIKVIVDSELSTGNVGHKMLAHAAEMDADLLVMGCYGHSRFREILLGGVTHTVLHSMNIPVLMSH